MSPASSRRPGRDPGNRAGLGGDRGRRRHRGGLRARARVLTLAVYTALQLFEVLVASAILLYGVLRDSPTITLLGGGYLIGKSILKFLPPQGGTWDPRSVIRYGLTPG